MDVVKPGNLNIEFLREFMMLPTSYYVPGAALKFRKFLFKFDSAIEAKINTLQP